MRIAFQMRSGVAGKVDVLNAELRERIDDRVRDGR